MRMLLTSVHERRYDGHNASGGAKAASYLIADAHLIEWLFRPSPTDTIE
jgi:hypothetical protein